MTTIRPDALSVEELSSALAAYAGPAHARTRPRRAWNAWMSRRLVLALLGALLIAGSSYAANVNPFRWISAANRPANASDKLPASLVRSVASWNTAEGKSSPFHVFLGSARLVRKIPSGMRVYTFATRSGALCAGVSSPPKSFSPGIANVLGSFNCGYSLSRDMPFSIRQEMNGSSTPSGTQTLGTLLSYGLALDGVTALTFSAGLSHFTVPVTDNVWVHLGRLGGRTVIVHWNDGTTEKLWSSPVDGTWSRHRPRS